MANKDVYYLKFLLLFKKFYCNCSYHSFKNLHRLIYFMKHDIILFECCVNIILYNKAIRDTVVCVVFFISNFILVFLIFYLLSLALVLLHSGDVMQLWDLIPLSTLNCMLKLPQTQLQADLSTVTKL